MINLVAVLTFCRAVLKRDGDVISDPRFQPESSSNSQVSAVKLPGKFSAGHLGKATALNLRGAVCSQQCSGSHAGLSSIFC